MIVATNNKGKITELKSIINELDLYTLKEKNINIDVVEDEDTFLGNAKKKAKEIYEISKEETIADDSGLCIDCLDGFPGVLTHRFLGDNKTDEERNDYLINEVNKYDNRKAKVVCYLVYYNGKDYIVGEGIIEGEISKEKRGKNGFGFDEIFLLPNGKTLAELSPEEKNEVSARSLAAKDLVKKLKKILTK